MEITGNNYNRVAYWQHFNLDHQLNRINNGEFDRFYIQGTGQYTYSGDNISERWGFVYCGNFFADVALKHNTTANTYRVVYNTEFKQVFHTRFTQDMVTELCKNRNATIDNAFVCDSQCSKCKREFRSTKAIQRHVSNNSCKHKMFECQCGKWFSTYQMFQRHENRNETIDCHLVGSDNTYLSVLYAPDRSKFGFNWHQQPHLCSTIRLHKTQLKVQKKNRNILNTIIYQCACSRKYYDEKRFKQHLTKCSSRELAKTNATIEHGPHDNKTRRAMVFREVKMVKLQDQPELYSYLFGNGDRPTHIKGDVRLMGFRYIGNRSSNMNIIHMMTPESIEREQKHGDYFYNAASNRSARFY